MIRSVLLALVLTTPALAEVPQVVTDTAPVQSLVAQVMGDLGTPELLVPPGTSPHDFAFRPSQARALAEADLVVWTGPELAPWLADALGEAPALRLLASPGWTPLEGEAHGLDPHAWLDAEIAATWLGTIAGRLSEADPANGATYLANAESAAGALQDLDAAIAARLAPLSDRGFLVPHDAYGYFARRYDLALRGAITGEHGEAPGPAHLSGLRDLAAAGEVVCLLVDPETDATWLDLVDDGTGLSRATVDADGSSLAPGPGLHAELLDGLATALAACLAP